jgi:hypothetical protein
MQSRSLSVSPPEVYTTFLLFFDDFSDKCSARYLKTLDY